MATGDQLVIRARPTGPLSASYTTAASQSIEVTSGTATFDGTGAGGDFKPALGFYDPNGTLLSRAVASDTVTAGSSAEVSFFPFVPQSSGGAVAARIFFARYDSVTPLSIPTATPTTLLFHRFASNDGSGVALDFGTIAANEATLVSPTFSYSLWASVYWPAFAGNRTAALATFDEEIGWAYPIEVTNAEQVQWVAGLVRPDFNFPTYLTLTLTQTSGGPQVIQNATILAQASELL